MTQAELNRLNNSREALWSEAYGVLHQVHGQGTCPTCRGPQVARIGPISPDSWSVLEEVCHLGCESSLQALLQHREMLKFNGERWDKREPGHTVMSGMHVYKNTPQKPGHSHLRCLEILYAAGHPRLAQKN